MGMDVSGINPTVVGTKPKWPENFRDLSNAEQDAYYEAKNKFYDNNPGVYFRANVWSWRPIMEALWESGACYELEDKEWEHMSFNDGAGAKDQETCDRMVSKLKVWLSEQQWDNNNQWTPAAFDTDDMQIDMNGTFIKKEKALEENIATRSPYSVHKEHLEEWITFLEHCGGFEVW